MSRQCHISLVVLFMCLFASADDSLFLQKNSFIDLSDANVTAISKHLSAECLEVFQTLPQVNLIYMYSGKAYNDFGRFEQCTNNDVFEYMLVVCKEQRCNNKLPIDLSLGLCVPKQCS